MGCYIVENVLNSLHTECSSAMRRVPTYINYHLFAIPIKEFCFAGKVESKEIVRETTMSQCNLRAGSRHDHPSKLGIISDSLLATIQVGSTRILRPDRETTTSLHRTLAVGLDHQNVDIRQFSYSGLSAITSNRNAATNRNVLFRQLSEIYPDFNDRPKIWYVCKLRNDRDRFRPGSTLHS